VVAQPVVGSTDASYKNGAFYLAWHPKNNSEQWFSFGAMLNAKNSFRDQVGGLLSDGQFFMVSFKGL